LIYAFLFGFSPIVHGQDAFISFGNGVVVNIRTEFSQTKQNKRLNSFSDPQATDTNILHRMMIDPENRLYFGYDLQVIPQPDTNQFKVSIKPLSTKPDIELLNMEKISQQKIPKYPNEFSVEEGDTIVLVLLENKQTGEKVSDLIKVTFDNGESFFAEKKEVRDFTLNDVQLQLSGFTVFVNDKRIGSGGEVKGGNIYVYLPGKGRFIFSPFERAGYDFRKIGMIVNNQITFIHNGEKYKIISDKPILGAGEKWHLWILFDNDYVPTKKEGEGLKMVFGEADNIKTLFGM
jgi:hypothetical protein